MIRITKMRNEQKRWYTSFEFVVYIPIYTYLSTLQKVISFYYISFSSLSLFYFSLEKLKSLKSFIMTVRESEKWVEFVSITSQ